MGKRKEIDRRTFMELSVQGSIGVGLATLPITAFSGCTSNQVKLVHGACYHDCPDRCSWTVKTINEEIKEFQASPDNPFTAGKLCNKMINFPNDVTFHPDRILTPLKRVGKKGQSRLNFQSTLTLLVSNVSYSPLEQARV